MPSVGRTRLCPGPAVHWHVHNRQREHSSRGEVAAARGGHTARTNPCFETPNQSQRTPPVTHRKLPAKHTRLVGGAQRPLLPARLTNAAPSSSVPTDRCHPTRRQLQHRWHSKDAQLRTETNARYPSRARPTRPWVKSAEWAPRAFNGMATRPKLSECSPAPLTDASPAGPQSRRPAPHHGIGRQRRRSHPWQLRRTAGRHPPRLRAPKHLVARAAKRGLQERVARVSAAAGCVADRTAFRAIGLFLAAVPPVEVRELAAEEAALRKGGSRVRG